MGDTCSEWEKPTFGGAGKKLLRMLRGCDICAEVHTYLDCCIPAHWFSAAAYLEVSDAEGVIYAAQEGIFHDHFAYGFLPFGDRGGGEGCLVDVRDGRVIEFAVDLVTQEGIWNPDGDPLPWSRENILASAERHFGSLAEFFSHVCDEIVAHRSSFIFECIANGSAGWLRRALSDPIDICGFRNEAGRTPIEEAAHLGNKRLEWILRQHKEGTEVCYPPSWRRPRRETGRRYAKMLEAYMKQDGVLTRCDGPKPEAYVQRAERRLGVRFPDAHRRFLLDFGCAEGDAAVIFGLFDGATEDDCFPGIVWANRKYRQELALPDNYLVVAQDNAGRLYGTDLGARGKARYTLVPSTGKPPSRQTRWRTFESLALHLLELAYNDVHQATQGE